MNCLIVYTSMTGNTEEMAGIIAAGIKDTGISAVVKEILEVDVSELQDFNAILLGAYTWGDGDLPDEFMDFYEDMDGFLITGKIAAAFGSCDSSYQYWGRAVEILTNRLTECGADVVHPGLKIDLVPTESEKEQCYLFGQFIAEKMRGAMENEYTRIGAE